MSAFVQSIEYFVPDRVITNADLALEFPEWSVDKITEKTGIHQRHVASAEETAVDLAEQACDRLFDGNSTSRDEIDFLLFCTQTPDYQLPNSASLLQQRLRLPKNIGALDINLGCSGYVYGLATAKGLLQGGVCGNVLLVCADTYTKIIHPSDRSNRVLFGDAATATYISKDAPGMAIGEFVFGTDGDGFDNLIVRNGGAKHRGASGGTIYNQDGSFQSDDNFLRMNGPAIFAFASKEVPRLVQRLMSKEEIALGEVDRFVFHQANRYMMEHLRRRLKIPLEQFTVEMEKFGNTVSSSIPIALKESFKKRPCLGGEVLLLAGFGVGLSMAACTMRMSPSESNFIG